MTRFRNSLDVPRVNNELEYKFDFFSVGGAEKKGTETVGLELLFPPELSELHGNQFVSKILAAASDKIQQLFALQKGFSGVVTLLNFESLSVNTAGGEPAFRDRIKHFKEDNCYLVSHQKNQLLFFCFI